jgi:hypothetical protein
MKRFLIALGLLGSTFALPALAADVGVSVSIGQPGFYGQIDIGGYPRPAVIYSQPVIVEPVHVVRPPIYMHVPPGHAKHWSKHCYRYGACGQHVYFVRDSWYQQEYVPRHRGRHDDHWRHDGRRHDRHDHDRHERGHRH